MSQFLGKPTRGGMLTILNCSLWLLLACVARFAPGPLMILFVIVPLISLPGIACVFVLLSLPQSN